MNVPASSVPVVKTFWYRRQCNDCPGCFRGDHCTYLHGEDDHRPGVVLQRAHDAQEQARLMPAEAIYRPQEQCIGHHASQRPEPPAIETAASEALLKWLADRLLESRQVTTS
jgi:hypothetical protein